jgi:hypothetical protein
MKHFTIILILVTLTMNIGFSSQALQFNIDYNKYFPTPSWSGFWCKVIPNYKTKITNVTMPNLKIKIPCNWTATWSEITFANSNPGVKNYKLMINDSIANRLTLLFLYFAAGCAESSCYQSPTLGYTTIGSHKLREKAQDPLIQSWFPTIAHDVHYHEYVSVVGPYATTSIKKPFPFGIGQTNYVNTASPIRIVYAIGQKTVPADAGLLDMDDIITSMIL